MAERTEEEIQEEIDAVDAELRALESMPAKFTVHGQDIDNTSRLQALKDRLRHLNAELTGRSVYNGPDLVV
ncbi:MAG TPA: hypothetical protein VK181_05530 [Rhizobium sp.]|nr:hypothetical protein [Rhizobium sp.]